jgi:hypothetical protein
MKWMVRLWADHPLFAGSGAYEEAPFGVALTLVNGNGFFENEVFAGMCGEKKYEMANRNGDYAS